MDNNIEQEICNNCKKEIPQPNYIMHTMHCARNITMCKVCKEPIPKSQFSDHEKTCKPKPLPPPLTSFEKSSYYQSRKAVEDKKVDARRERYLQRMEKLVDTGYTLKDSNSRDVQSHNREKKSERTEEKVVTKEENATATKSSGMLACKYCDLDLPKLELEDHENYCGSRTDKCLECGELVMFKDKQAHMDSNHAHLKKKGGRRWDSSTQRDESASRPRRNGNVRNFGELEYDPMPYLPAAYQAPGGGAKKKEGDSYKEISRRLDCKTEYIRNILHDSAAITVPLRRSGTAPRNYFYHDLKGPTGGPPTPPPVYRRRNPPTELVIPCEFCNVPVPHEDLIQHETGCRPDLTRLNSRRGRSSPTEDDYYVETRGNAAAEDDEELPCEFCGDMIPASRLYSHQIQCN